MSTEQIIQTAQRIRDRYVDHIVAILQDFRKELEGAGYYSGHLYTFGYLETHKSSTWPIEVYQGAFWMLRGQILYLDVMCRPMNNKRIVTLEFPLHRDIGMHKGWEERLKLALRKKYLNK